MINETLGSICIIIKKLTIFKYLLLRFHNSHNYKQENHENQIKMN